VTSQACGKLCWLSLALIISVAATSAPGLARASSAAVSSVRTVTLATNIASAFTSDVPTQEYVHDLSPNLNCIFKDLQLQHKVKTMPWRRAYQEVKNNRIDGFFTAIPMRQVDPYAVLSAPLVLETWYWYWRKDTVAPESWREGYKLGSILGSQQETWLDEAGYSIEMSANNLPQLIKLLKTKRIDVVLADREHFLQATKEVKLSVDMFQSRFFRYMPLGVYFNEAFLNANPGFLPKFNQSIAACASAPFNLTAFEQQQIQELLIRKIERWKHLPGLEPALIARNKKVKNLSANDIATMDRKWIEAFKVGDFSYSLKVVDQELSAQLREIKKESQGQVTEIIVTDARGLNLAISDLTSDYWQGDEEKFTTAFGQSGNQLFFNAIMYDESTKHFQVHISVPLASESGEPLGVMIFGVDVEKVLAQIQ
jgi:ABC-type amino acid transport substrate-binding protein